MSVCKGKEPFLSRKDATRAAMAIMRRREKKKRKTRFGKCERPIEVYACEVCGEWHLTHKREGGR